MQLTRIPFEERSDARPLVRERMPPFRAPPTAADGPGLIASWGE